MGTEELKLEYAVLFSNFKHLENYEKWKNLASIIKVESVREFKK